MASSKPTATVYAAPGQTVVGSTRYDLDIVLSPLWVQLDIVGDPAVSLADDIFELRTTDDDTYSQTRTVGSATASGDRRLLRFTDLVPDRDYSLVRRTPGLDDLDTVFPRRSFHDIVNGAGGELVVAPAATFVASQFVWANAEAGPLTDCLLYLAHEQRRFALAPGDRDPAELVLEAYEVDSAGQYRPVPAWPEATIEEDLAAPSHEPSTGGAGYDRVLLDLEGDSWRAAVSSAPLTEFELAQLWSELLGEVVNGHRKWTSFEPGLQVELPQALTTFRIRIEPLATRIDAPAVFGAPRPRPDPLVRISIEGGVAERSRIEVHDGDGLVYAEEHTDRYVSAGEDVWAWDGVSDSGVFDTPRELRVEVFLHKDGQVTKASQGIRTESGPMAWADLRFDIARERADVMFHIDVQNEGFADVTTPLTDQPIPLTFGRKISDAEFQRLKALVLEGVSYHWSRTGRYAVRGARLGPSVYETFEVHTTGLERSREPSLDVDVYVNRRPTYARGSNPLLWDSSVFYNEAFFISEGSGAPRSAADADLAVTAAHEIGHTVLYRTQGLRESMTHHGTSTVFQSIRDDAPIPTGVDDDLMKYPAGPPGAAFVSEQDAIVLCESFCIRVFGE